MAADLPTGVRAVYFDAVGTLLHPDPPAAEVYAHTGRQFGSRLTTPAIAIRFREAFARQEQLDARDGFRTSEEREVQRWRHIVAEVLDDVTDIEACYRQLHTHFARPEAWRCEPEAQNVLRELSSQGLALGLASNYDHRLHLVLEGVPALHLISSVVISSEVGWRKPAPSFFTSLCRTAGLPAESILLVGDDPVTDYAGARAAGLHAVLFDPANRLANAPVTRISRLGDLLA